MVHNQTNADRLQKLSVTFLENVWLARMTLKAKMERNRSAHHVPDALQKINCPGNSRLAKVTLLKAANATMKESKTVVIMFILLVLLSYLKNIHNTIAN